VLDLTYFQINTSQIPNLKTWLEQTIRINLISQASPYYSFIAKFDEIPENFDPGQAVKISLPFEISSSKTLETNLELEIRFAS
jgi:hypothetical protein